MSTKIYDAYRYTGKDFYGFLAEVKTQGQAVLKSNLEDIMAALLKNRYTNPSWAEFIGDYPQPTRYQAADWAWTRIRDMALSASRTIQRDSFDPDSCLQVIPHKGRYYLRAFDDRASLIARGTLTPFLQSRLGTDVEDYHYQNQADQPKDVSPTAWASRKRTWGAIMGSEGLPKVSLELRISDFESLYRHNPSFTEGFLDKDFLAGFKPKA